MAMNTTGWRLDLWEGHKNGTFLVHFLKKSIFNEDLPSEDDITDKIWWKIFVMLSAQDPAFLIGFSEILLETL